MATDNEIYTRYRRGLIQRHIAKNGRLLEGIWLIEDGGGTSTAAWQAIRRSTSETLENGASYSYNAYPLLIADQFYDQPRQLYLAGGGDNPLLMGGLAMAVFAIEALLNVSTRSLEQAQRLLSFARSSQVRTRAGGHTGFFTRKRHFYRRSDQFSMDEITGMLVGLLFLMKATRKSGEEQLTRRVSTIARQLGRFLQDNEYMLTAPNEPGRGDPSEVRGQFAFVFQFPFGRALKDITGDAWKSDATIPDEWDNGLGLLVSELAKFLKRLTLDFNYTPRELFEDVVGIYGGIFNINQDNLFNATMVVYCLLMVIESTATHEDTRVKIARLGNDVIKAITHDRGSFDGAKKPFRHSCLFAVIAKRCAEICGDGDSGWNDALDRKIARLQDGDKTWFPDLPLGTPSEAATPRFSVRNSDGKLFWGGWYAWTEDGTRDDPDYSFMNQPSWDEEKTVRHIGPFASNEGQVSAIDLAPQYSADPSRGLRVESSGIDFLFARVLASYYGYLPKPVLQNGDPAYASLPVDGPLSDGFLANVSTGELHDLSVAARGCFLDKLLRANERWYEMYRQASKLNHYNDCGVCLPRYPYRHAIGASPARPYVGNKRSNKVHSRVAAQKQCHVESISSLNVLYYNSVHTAFLDGLRPCSFCIGDSDGSK